MLFVAGSESGYTQADVEKGKSLVNEDSISQYLGAFLVVLEISLNESLPVQFFPLPVNVLSQIQS